MQTMHALAFSSDEVIAKQNIYISCVSTSAVAQYLHGFVFAHSTWQYDFLFFGLAVWLLAMQAVCG